MTPAEAKLFLQKHDAIKKGHFKLASGLHSEYYIQKNKIIQYPKLVEKLIKSKIDLLKDIRENYKIDIVISAAVGGIALGQQLALELDCRAIYAERNVKKKLCLKRDFCLNKGERVIIAEDVITTGSTIGELKKIINRSGAILEGTFALFNRSQNNSFFNLPLISCMDIYFENYTPEELPSFLKKRPLIIPGTKASEKITHKKQL